MATYDSSTAIITAEARRRGISVLEFPEAGTEIVLLERGAHREWLYYTGTDRLGRVTFKIFLHKFMATAVLRRAGFLVPDEIFTDNVADAVAFLRRYERIVVKPVDLVWGQGVTPGITSDARVAAAIAHAQAHNANQKEKRVICQQHITGEEYRVLVVNQQHVFAVRRIPAHVVGDGQQTVQALLDAWNETVMTERRLKVSEGTEDLLAEQGMSLDAVPASGQRVFLTRVANAHAGGTVHDATGRIGASVRATAVAIARYFAAPVVGIDCITADIGTTIGYIIELNSTPDITLHHQPTEGQPRDVAGRIVDMLFPETMTHDASDSSASGTAR